MLRYLGKGKHKNTAFPDASTFLGCFYARQYQFQVAIKETKANPQYVLRATAPKRIIELSFVCPHWATVCSVLLLWMRVERKPASQGAEWHQSDATTEEGK